jgi:hypothetical protein
MTTRTRGLRGLTRSFSLPAFYSDRRACLRPLAGVFSSPMSSCRTRERFSAGGCKPEALTTTRGHHDASHTRLSTSRLYSR